MKKSIMVMILITTIVVLSIPIFAGSLRNDTATSDTLLQEQPDTLLQPVSEAPRGEPKTVPWDTVITLIISMLGWFGMYKYWAKFKQVITQLKLIFETVNNAIEDDKLTNYELKMILQEIRTFLKIFTGLPEPALE